MTVQEMHNAVKLGVQTLDSFTHDLMLPEEIDVILNQMQDRFIKQRFFNRANNKGVGFEETTKRLHDLQTLIKVNDAEVNTTSDYKLSVPEDCKFIIDLKAAIKYNGEEITDVPIEITENEKYVDLLNNPFRTTTYKNILAVLRNNEITVFVKNKFILIGLEIVYLKNPVAIDINLENPINCELPEHTHNEIVDMAIQSILEKIESPRYQTIINENINNE